MQVSLTEKKQAHLASAHKLKTEEQQRAALTFSACALLPEDGPVQRTVAAVKEAVEAYLASEADRFDKFHQSASEPAQAAREQRGENRIESLPVGDILREQPEIVAEMVLDYLTGVSPWTNAFMQRHPEYEPPKKSGKAAKQAFD